MTTFDVARTAAFAATLLVFGAGCDDAAPTGSTASAQAVSSARPAATVAQAPTATATAATDDDIPTSADFEIEAAKEIHPSNVETELATLEKEIAADD